MSSQKYKLLEMEKFNSRRDQFAVVFGVILVLLTVFLIIDIQVGLNITHDYTNTFESAIIIEEIDSTEESDKSDVVSTFP